MGTKASGGLWRLAGGTGVLVVLLAYYQLCVVRQMTRSASPYQPQSDEGLLQPTTTPASRPGPRLAGLMTGDAEDPPRKGGIAIVMADNRDFRSADGEYLPWATLLNLR
jgi:hypothetical protein